MNWLRVALPNGEFCLLDHGFSWIPEKFKLVKCKAYVLAERRFETEYATAVERVYVHRLVMKLRPNSKFQVDHINRNPLDNRSSNLRLATAKQNAANTQKKTRAKSGYRGVIKRSDKLNRPWLAYCGPKKRSGGYKSIGYFATASEAAHAYDKAALQRWGEFAILNFESNRVRHGA